MVHLVPISQEEFQPWLDNAIAEYAHDKAQAGNWPAAEAIERSAQEFAQLLPAGPATPGQHLFSIRADDQPSSVGVIWFSETSYGGQPVAFVYDFVIFEPFRRRGYGEQALRAVEAEVRALGLGSIGLHVFGHNHAARALYEKVGYSVTNVNMAKQLGDPASGG